MNLLKKARKKAGISQESVAIKLNVTQGAISQWEKGKSLPRAELLPKLAALYGCTVDELLSERPAG